jgi:hypothetical protein
MNVMDVGGSGSSSSSRRIFVNCENFFFAKLDPTRGF